VRFAWRRSKDLVPPGFGTSGWVVDLGQSDRLRRRCASGTTPPGTARVRDVPRRLPRRRRFSSTTGHLRCGRASGNHPVLLPAAHRARPATDTGIRSRRPQLAGRSRRPRRNPGRSRPHDRRTDAPRVDHLRTLSDCDCPSRRSPLRNAVGSPVVIQHQAHHVARLATSLTHARVAVVPLSRCPILPLHGWEQRDHIVSIETTAAISKSLIPTRSPNTVTEPTSSPTPQSAKTSRTWSRQPQRPLAASHLRTRGGGSAECQSPVANRQSRTINRGDVCGQPQ
jgi:hypothetical protein